MYRQYGFSLIEMGVVLLIMGLLLGGLLGPLSSRQQMDKIESTEQGLEVIRKALLGYAIRHGRLPCPDTDNPIDGLENRGPNGRCNHPTGVTSAPSLADQRIVVAGSLPYTDLQTGSVDAFGNTYLYTVSLSYTDRPEELDPTPFPELTSTSNPPPSGACELARDDLAPRPTFTTCSKGGIRVLETAGDASSLLYDDLPFMVLSQGFNRNTVGNSNEAENSDADRTFVLRPINTSEGHLFDDVLMWIPAPVLALALVESGRLP